MTDSKGVVAANEYEEMVCEGYHDVDLVADRAAHARLLEKLTIAQRAELEADELVINIMDDGAAQTAGGIYITAAGARDYGGC